MAIAKAMAKTAVSAEVLLAISQAAILPGQLVANPVLEQEAIPAVALAPAAIVEEELGCLAVVSVVQARFHHAYENSSSFDKGERHHGAKVPSTKCGVGSRPAKVG
ncbi:MAG: hypothetical protein FWD08_04215 [Alphaproteobacteria bacterium]|nr:hypothetical protein [Alphaproteobacteria bacterium]MCL2452840.1 hypothetical protein [Alphaproteobacteria bacterium]